MTFDADAIADRRRLKRRLSLWRISAVVAVAGAVLAVAGVAGVLPGRDHVARIAITGLIVNNDARQEMLASIAGDDNVKALIVHINSPGGSTVGSEALFTAISKVTAKKPVVAVMDSVAASGGYIAAVSADHIIARHNTLTGSIGVILQWPEVSGLLDKIGVEIRDVKTGPLKAQPSYYERADPGVVQALESLVQDSYEWFARLVSERRGMELADVWRLADGRVFTGAQALEAGLIDQIGDQETARDWLRNAHNISADLPVRDWSESTFGEQFDRMGGHLLGKAAGAALVTLLGELGVSGHPPLDGLVSLWQAQD